MTEQEAQAIFQQGEEATVAWMLATDQRLRQLESRLGLNSQNSSKPPSSDQPGGKTLKPPGNSLREKTGKKPGGQKGHKGNTLQQVDVTDEKQIRDHRPTQCPHCNTDLREAESAGYTRRQVFDIPEPVLEVVEHRAHALVCPCCAASVKAQFPESVDQPVQYGPNIVGLGVYLHAQHLVPFGRCAQILREISGSAFSAGTLFNQLVKAFGRLRGFEEDLKSAVGDAPILHVDETSVRQEGSRYWIHTRSTGTLTWLFAHKRRGGAEVMADLKEFGATLVSDFWSSYLKLNCAHQFCVAHLCRELQGAFEGTGQSWALDLKEHLLDCNEACRRARARKAGKLWDARRRAALFDALVQEGLSQTPLPSKGKSKGKVRNLLERLWGYRDQVLGFLFDLSLPFTNNEAERSVRMPKVKAKVSGGFRTSQGVVVFCRLRSYTQTCAKQGMNVLQCIRSLFSGQPIMPSLNPA